MLFQELLVYFYVKGAPFSSFIRMLFQETPLSTQMMHGFHHLFERYYRKRPGLRKWCTVFIIYSNVITGNALVYANDARFSLFIRMLFQETPSSTQMMHGFHYLFECYSRKRPGLRKWCTVFIIYSNVITGNARPGLRKGYTVFIFYLNVISGNYLVLRKGCTVYIFYSNVIHVITGTSGLFLRKGCTFFIFYSNIITGNALVYANDASFSINGSGWWFQGWNPGILTTQGGSFYRWWHNLGAGPLKASYILVRRSS